MRYREIMMYIIMGIFTTIVNIVSFYFLTSAFEMDYKAATVAAWVLSVLFAYVTNKLYVFQQKTAGCAESDERIDGLFQRAGIALAIDLAMMILLVSQFHMNETLANRR